MASTQNPVSRKFVIFHPSDFSLASEVAFGHALKIALQSKAKLDIMHVMESHVKQEKASWLDFPAVRATLTRWHILPNGVRQEEVAKAGLRIRKILSSSADPVESMLRHFHRFPPDLTYWRRTRGNISIGGRIKRSQSRSRAGRER